MLTIGTVVKDPLTMVQGVVTKVGGRFAIDPYYKGASLYAEVLWIDGSTSVFLETDFNQFEVVDGDAERN